MLFYVELYMIAENIGFKNVFVSLLSHSQQCLRPTYHVFGQINPPKTFTTSPSLPSTNQVDERFYLLV